MLNITPDTRFHWAGGCWTAMPSAPKTAVTHAGAAQPISPSHTSANEPARVDAQLETGKAESEHPTAKAA